MIASLRTVLVTTDFSELAADAIGYAYAAVAEGGTVHLLHVLELHALGSAPNPLYAHYAPGHAPSPEERDRIHATCAERLRALVPAGAEARQIRTEVHVLDDPDVGGAIVRAADECDAALICIASHGRSALVRSVLGSVAQSVLGSTHRPVLVTRPTRRADKNDYVKS